MTDVSRIQTSTSGVSTGLLRSGIFNAAISSQGQWQGGAKHAYVPESEFLGVGEQSATTDAQVEFVKQEKPVSVQIAAMRKFFGGGGTYFPPVDYQAYHRETALFESVRGKAVPSSSWKQIVAY